MSILLNKVPGRRPDTQRIYIIQRSLAFSFYKSFTRTKTGDLVSLHFRLRYVFTKVSLIFLFLEFAMCRALFAEDLAMLVKNNSLQILSGVRDCTVSI